MQALNDFVDDEDPPDDDGGQSSLDNLVDGSAEVSGGDSDVLDLKVMNVEYTESPSGTVIHVFGRASDGRWRHVEITGHDPSFYIREDAYSERIDNHYAVKRVDAYDADGDRYTDLHGNECRRIYVNSPDSVPEMREMFDWTGEADVHYEKRWLIDSDVMTGIRVDTTDAITDQPWLKGEMRVSMDDIEALDTDDTPSVDPKQVVFDIEVGSEDGVPDADTAEWPVTTIVAWDTHSHRYVGWLLLAPSHERSDVNERVDETELDDLRIFTSESSMLHDFNEYLRDQRPDILTGWYSNDFDLPYLINRCKNLNTYNFSEWSPLDEVWDGHFEPNVSGVACVDMLEAYKKTQIHNLKKKGLSDVARTELDDADKLDVEDGHTEMWRESPIEFLRYNKVDVELVHEIDTEVGVVNLLDNLRTVIGCSYTDPIGGNIDMMDVVFLRKAQEYGYVLPTAEKPDVGDFHGAYVYTPEAGLHKHVVYPDYSSLYPNMLYQCNISPETLIGTKDDLEASEYDEDDCVWSYVDTSTPPAQKSDVEADEDDMEKMYFLKPSVEEGFVRSVLDDIMGMASRYTGGMYAAVKRVRNSTYGVLGDSDSYNRGFRLFDWRMAEATTLGGQRVLKEGGRKFTEFVDDPDARVIYGDTDSVVTTFPNADSGDDALQQAFDAADRLNDYLDEFAAEQFGLESPSDARMEIEIESYSRGIFFKGQNDGRSEKGIKKRYAQLEAWDDDDGWLDEPELTIKGFEYVRSDVADVTADVQETIFTEILSEDIDTAETNVKDEVRQVVTDIMGDDYDMARVGIPFGISQSLDEYGSQDQKPQPQYRGAKFANAEIYGGDAIGEGDKPFYYYIQEGQTGDLRKTYDSHTKEDGEYVDCISVLDWRDMPDGVTVDRPKMIEKTVQDPCDAIFRTLDWGTEWLDAAVEQATPPSYYRDESQQGLDAWEAM